MSMYLSIRYHIFGTTRPIFIKYLCVLPLVAVARWRSNMLCTSGFMDDVIFAPKPRLEYGLGWPKEPCMVFMAVNGRPVLVRTSGDEIPPSLAIADW